MSKALKQTLIHLQQEQGEVVEVHLYGGGIVAKSSDSESRLHRFGSCLLHLGKTSLLLCGLDNMRTSLRDCFEDYMSYSSRSI